MNDNNFVYWLTQEECNVKLKFLFKYFKEALKEIETEPARYITFFKENLGSKPKTLEELRALVPQNS